MKNIQYQQKAVSELVEKTIGLLSLSGNRHTLIFKAPTGSGKTVMASEMLMRLNDELAERPDAPFTEVAYIWIAPNKLHEQSYFKMKNHGLRRIFSLFLALFMVFTLLPTTALAEDTAGAEETQPKTVVVDEGEKKTDPPRAGAA